MSLNESRVRCKERIGGLGNELASLERTDGKQSHNGEIIGHVSLISDFFERPACSSPRRTGRTRLSSKTDDAVEKSDLCSRPAGAATG